MLSKIEPLKTTDDADEDAEIGGARSLPLDRWHASLGTDGSGFDPHRELEQRLGRPLDKEAFLAGRRAMRDEILDGKGPMPGIPQLLAAAGTDGAGGVAGAGVEPLVELEERGQLAGVEPDPPAGGAEFEDHPAALDVQQLGVALGALLGAGLIGHGSSDLPVV